MDSIKDFIHYYYGQECMRAIIVPGQEPVFEKDPINARTLFELEQGLALIKPIVRKLSSMTIDEYHAIEKHLSVGVILAINSGRLYSDRPDHVLILENRVQTNTLLFNDGLELMKHGYWVFGQEAFEKGLIIEKK